MGEEGVEEDSVVAKKQTPTAPMSRRFTDDPIRELYGEVRALQERMAALEKQHETEKEHDRQSRHNFADRTHNAITALSVEFATGLQSVNEKLAHQDTCIDKNREVVNAALAEAKAARTEVTAVKGEVAEVKKDVQEVAKDLKEVKQTTAVGAKDSSTAAKGATRSPWVVAIIVVLDAYAKHKGWW